MDRIRIIGGERLKGTIPISGAKNAALPLMIASLLTRETLVLKNVPRLADVTLLGRILGNHGVDITAVGKKVGQSTIDGQTFKLKAAEIVPRLTKWSRARVRASGCSRRFSRAAARPRYLCQVAAPSARGPSICT
jgi:UDP-N-acetylglucosamine 1-carboxyvinyltransferase